LKKEGLRAIWAKLSQTAIEPGRSYKILRFDENCSADVFVGMTRSGDRCLILSEPAPVLKPIEREKLCLEYDESIPGLVLRLSDDTYSDLFDELISSMYIVVKDLTSKQDAIEKFRAHFIKWSAFFDSEFYARLSDEAVMGLVGELKVLQWFLAEADELTVNAILESWRGPYDEGQDFVLDDRLIEVKTVGIRSRHITINSLHQLTEAEGKDLNLLINTAFPEIENGDSINSLVTKIRDETLSLLGDTSILYKALSQKGLGPRNLEDYEHLRFGFRKEDIFDVLLDGFPRLTNAVVLDGITSAKYDLSLSALKPFLTSSREY
jgi:hypothetical protein